MKTMAMLAVATCLSVPVLPQGEPDSALDAFLAAYRVADPQAVSRLFGPDALFIGPDGGEPLRGERALHEHFTRTWPGGTRNSIDCTGVVTQRVAPTVAVVGATCRTETTPPNGRALRAALSLMLVATQDSGGWRITAMHLSTPPARR